MFGYLFRRLAWAAVLFFVVTFVTYVIFFVIPTDRTRFIRRTEVVTPDIRRAVNIHGPVYKEYAQFVWHLGHGSMGRSFTTRENVNEIVGRAAPVTASLVVGGALLWLAIALPVGILSALRPRSLLDRGAMVFVLIGVSAHPVWIGLIFSYLFGFRLHVTPVTGYCDFFNPPPGSTCGGPRQWAYHMVLPWLTFAMLFAAIYVRMIRANVTEMLGEDFVRTARAKGAPEWLVVRSHVLRTAMLPVVTMLGMDMGLALGGSVFIESVYSLPGLGRTALGGLNRSDLPTIMGVVVFATLAIVVINLVVDLVYAAVDPRVRLGRSIEASD